MPEKLHRCVDKVKGEKGEDSAYAICNSSIKEDINRSGKPQGAGAGGGGGDAAGWHRKPLIDVGHIGTTAEAIKEADEIKACGNCRFFVAGGKCQRVIGEIDAHDLCDLWSYGQPQVLGAESVPTFEKTEVAYRAALIIEDWPPNVQYGFSHRNYFTRAAYHR